MRILATLSFIFITLALRIIAITPPVTGYEISIYDAYPVYFWFLIIAAITFGVLILLLQSFAEIKSSWWLIGLGIIIFGNSILLLLPMFRGYALYGRWDTLTHLGNIKNILATGHIGIGNYYPILHILGTISIQVSGLSLEDMLCLFFVLFTNVYILNIYLLAKSSSKHHSQVLLILAFSSPLIYSFYHLNIHPNMISLFMVPLLLYFYQEREKLVYNLKENNIILLLLSFFITFCHPITAIYVIIIFLTYGLTNAFYYRFLNKIQSYRPHKNIGKNFLNISLIMFISVFTWYFSYSSIGYKFKLLYYWIVYQIGTPLIDVMLIQLKEANIKTFQTFELFINRHGAIFFLLLISGMSFLSVIWKILRKTHIDFINFIYVNAFMIVLFISTIMLFGYFPENEYNPVRIVRFPILIGTILSGLVVYDFINGKSKKNFCKKIRSQRLAASILIPVLIIIMLTLSIGSIYGSPRVWDVNSQVTEMDIAGTKWFGRFQNPELRVVENIRGAIRRFHTYNFGSFSNISKVNLYPERLPSHFGYDEYNNIAEVLGSQDKYIVIFGLDKAAQILFSKCPSPKVHIYTEQDFDKLNSDLMVAKIYCNGEFLTYLMCGN